jgi:hypothetical protein
MPLGVRRTTAKSTSESALTRPKNCGEEECTKDEGAQGEEYTDGEEMQSHY